jgi:hypothetical protein
MVLYFSDQIWELEKQQNITPSTIIRQEMVLILLEQVSFNLQ